MEKMFIAALVASLLIISGICAYDVVNVLSTPKTTFLNITTPNQIITLTRNISVYNCQYCIRILAENVTFDCNGFGLIGANENRSTAIYSDKTNTTIKNCIIKNFSGGVLFEYSSKSSLLNNNISTFGPFSVRILNSNHFNVSNNILNANMSVIYIIGSSNGYIGYNKATAIIAEPLAIVENTNTQTIADNNTIENNIFISFKRFSVYMQNAKNNTFNKNSFYADENVLRMVWCGPNDFHNNTYSRINKTFITLENG